MRAFAFLESIKALKSQYKIGFWISNAKYICFLREPSSEIIFDFRAQDWKEALHWYNAALNMTDYDEGGEYDGTQDEPRYLLLAREAEMLMMGGFNLDKDPQRSGEASFLLIYSLAFPSLLPQHVPQK